MFFCSFATAILWDSGSTVGDISYHQKNCNNVSIKQNRPYKLVVASDDQSTTFFYGVPFKLKTQFHDVSFKFLLQYYLAKLKISFLGSSSWKKAYVTLSNMYETVVQQ